MRSPASIHRLGLALACALAYTSVGAHAQEQAVESVVERTGFDQLRGNQIPLDLAFRDESGRAVRLADYFGERPVVLTLVYYECPMLCTQVLNGLVQCLRTLAFAPGEEFELVTISIQPKDTPELARAKKARYVAEYGHASAERGWHFLTGEREAIERVAASVGFRYVYDPRIEQFAHASGFVVATPQGRVSKYFYGVEYWARDLRLALVESASGGIGSLVDKVLLLCMHYDPEHGKYGFAIMSAIRLLAGLTVAALAAFVVVTLRRERRALPSTAEGG